MWAPKSLAVTIRVLMDENLTARQKFGLVVKEMRIGFANGLLLGAASFGAIGLFIWVVKGKGLWPPSPSPAARRLAAAGHGLISSAVGTADPHCFSKRSMWIPQCLRAPDHHVNDLVAVVS